MIDLFKEGWHSPIVYLQHPKDKQSDYYVKDLAPTYFVASEGGDFNFKLNASEVWLAGGYFHFCQQRTVYDVLNQWKDDRFKNKDLTLQFWTAGLYTDQKGIRQSDPYFRKYIDYVTIYGTKHITLAQLFRLIDDPTLIKNYLVREYDVVAQRLPEDRIVRISWRDQVIYERQPISPSAVGKNPKLLHLNFIEGGIANPPRIEDFKE